MADIAWCGAVVIVWSLAGVMIGGIAGLGLWLLILGARGLSVLPRRSGDASSGSNRPSIDPQTALLVGLIAAFAGIAVWQLTGWPIMAIVTVAAVILGRRAWLERGQDQRRLDRTEAIAVWAEMIRDNMSGAAGLEQALVLSAAYAPEAIAPEVGRFVSRLDRRSLYEGLGELGEELDNPAADMVVVSLAQASRTEARELGPLLTRLARSIRADVEMQQRVDIGRARIRTSARIVVLVTLVTIVLLMLISRNLLDAYNTPQGQLWMVVVISVFVLAFWLLHRYSQMTVAGRFRLRRDWLGEVEE